MWAVKRTAIFVTMVWALLAIAMLASYAETPRIELTEGQAAHIHDCFDNGWLARVTFNEAEQAEVICVAAY